MAQPVNIAQVMAYLNQHRHFATFLGGLVTMQTTTVWVNSGAPIPGYGNLRLESKPHEPAQDALKSLLSPTVQHFDNPDNNDTLSIEDSQFSASDYAGLNDLDPHVFSTENQTSLSPAHTFNSTYTITGPPASKINMTGMASAVVAIIGIVAMGAAFASAVRFRNGKPKAVTKEDMIAFLQLELNKVKTTISNMQGSDESTKEIIAALQNQLKSSIDSRIEAEKSAEESNQAYIAVMDSLKTVSSEAEAYRREKNNVLASTIDLKAEHVVVITKLQEILNDKTRKVLSMEVATNDLEQRYDNQLQTCTREKEAAEQEKTAAEQRYSALELSKASEVAVLRQDIGALDAQLNIAQGEIHNRDGDISQLKKEKEAMTEQLEVVKLDDGSKAEALRVAEEKEHQLQAELKTIRDQKDEDAKTARVSEQELKARLALLQAAKDNDAKVAHPKEEKLTAEIESLQKDIAAAAAREAAQSSELERLQKAKDDESEASRSIEEDLKAENASLRKQKVALDTEVRETRDRLTSQLESLEQEKRAEAANLCLVQARVEKLGAQLESLQKAKDAESEASRSIEEELKAEVASLQEQKVALDTEVRETRQRLTSQLESLEQDKNVAAAQLRLVQARGEELEAQLRDAETKSSVANDEAAAFKASEHSSTGKVRSDRVDFTPRTGWSNKNFRQNMKWAVKVGIIQQGQHLDSKLVEFRLPHDDPFYSDLPVQFPKPCEPSTQDGKTYEKCDQCNQVYEKTDFYKHLASCLTFFNDHAAVCKHCKRIFFSNGAFNGPKGHQDNCPHKVAAAPAATITLAMIPEYDIIGQNQSQLGDSPTALEVISLKIPTMSDELRNAPEDTVIRAVSPYKDPDFKLCKLPAPTEQTAIIPLGHRDGEAYAMKKRCYHCKLWYTTSNFSKHLPACIAFFRGTGDLPKHVRCIRCGDCFRDNVGFKKHVEECSKHPSTAACEFCGDVNKLGEAHDKHVDRCHKNPERPLWFTDDSNLGSEHNERANTTLHTPQTARMAPNGGSMKPAASPAQAAAPSLPKDAQVCRDCKVPFTGDIRTHLKNCSIKQGKNRNQFQNQLTLEQQRMKALENQQVHHFDSRRASPPQQPTWNASPHNHASGVWPMSNFGSPHSSTFTPPGHNRQYSGGVHTPSSYDNGFSAQPYNSRPQPPYCGNPQPGFTQPSQYPSPRGPHGPTPPPHFGPPRNGNGKGNGNGQS